MDLLQQLQANPEGTAIAEQTARALRWIGVWREPLVAAVLFLECLPAGGILVPGQIVLTVAGFWSSGQPPATVISMILTCLAAVLLADTLMYALGRYGTDRWGFLRRWLGENATFSRALSMQPFVVLVFYQFPPYSRMFAPLLFGAGRRAWGSWVRLCVLASSSFVLTFFGMGFFLGLAGKAALAGAGIAGIASAVGALALFTWLPFFVRRWLKLKPLEPPHA